MSSVGCCPTPWKQTSVCAALEMALQQGTCEIFNCDQGSQFTSVQFLQPLKDRSMAISMDGRGALDNVFIERLWRSVKYELIYPGDFASGVEIWPALNSLPLLQFPAPSSSAELPHASPTVSRRQQTLRRVSRFAAVCAFQVDPVAQGPHPSSVMKSTVSHSRKTANPRTALEPVLRFQDELVSSATPTRHFSVARIALSCDPDSEQPALLPISPA